MGECGEGVGKCVGVDGMSKKMWGRCGKVRLGVGKGKCGGRCREVLGEVCVGGVGKCVRVWREVWKNVGEGVGKCVGVCGNVG